MKMSGIIVANALISTNAKKIDVLKIENLVPTGCKVISPRVYGNTYRGPCISFYVKMPRGKEAEMYRRLQSKKTIIVDPNGDGFGESKVECLITDNIFDYLV